MPVPPNRSSRALTPIERRTHTFPLDRDADLGAAQRIARGGGSILTLPTGSIAGDVRAVAVDRRRKTVTYELRVVNETTSPLATFAYSADGATTDELTWSSIVVPARSSIALPIELGLVRGAVPRLIVQLFAERAALTLDAEPLAEGPRGSARGGGLAVLAAALLAVAGVAYAAERPRVVTLAAPATVEAGRTFEVGYALGSAQRARYTVERADGVEVGGGSLAGNSGAFAVSFPSGVAGGYDIVVETGSPFGAARRVAHVAAVLPESALASDPRRSARIAALEVERDDVAGGETFGVTYRSNARAGTLKLVDQDGTVRAEALLSPHGRSTLVAPLVERDQDMRVILDVERGASRAERGAPILVRAAAPSALGDRVAGWAASVGAMVARPPAPAAPQAEPAPAAGGIVADPSGTPPPGVAEGPLTFPSESYRSGATIELGVRYDESALHVMFEDARGTPFAERDVPAGTRVLRLTAPASAVAQHVLVVTSFARDVGRDTLIHPLTIVPP